MRQSVRGREPQSAVAIAVCNIDVAARQTVGGREIFDLPSFGVQPIKSSTRANIDPAEFIFGYTVRAVARESFGCRELGKFEIVFASVIQTQQTDRGIGQPHSSQVVYVHVTDPARRNTIIIIKNFETSVAIAI